MPHPSLSGATGQFPSRTHSDAFIFPAVDSAKILGCAPCLAP